MIIGVKLTILGLAPTFYGGTSEAPEVTKVEDLAPAVTTARDLRPTLTVVEED
jgi:hypothetical protein